MNDDELEAKLQRIFNGETDSEPGGSTFDSWAESEAEREIKEILGVSSVALPKKTQQWAAEHKREVREFCECWDTVTRIIKG